MSPELEGFRWNSTIPLQESDPADLVFYSQIPVDVATFMGSVSAEYKAAIAEVGDVVHVMLHVRTEIPNRGFVHNLCP